MTSSSQLQKQFTWTHVPDEVWIDILNRLRLTDLALVSQSCRRLNRLTRSSIKRYHRHDSPFTANYEFSHDGVPIEPSIHPESGLAICFDEFTTTLKVLHLSTGKVFASSPEVNNSPVSVKFSKTGKIVAALFDASVCFYILNEKRKSLIPCREIRFEVDVKDFIPPGYGRCRYGMGRMLVSFSQNDKKVAVAHIFESLGSTRFVTFRCLRANLLDEGTLKNITIDLKRIRRAMKVQETTTVRLQVDREFVSFWDILMNADPLRLLIPPGCMDDAGFLLDPKDKESMVCRRIMDYDGTLGSLISYNFSACGQHYFETRIISHVKCVLTITKFDLASGHVLSISEVLMSDFSAILGVLISNDSNLAVILLGTIASDTAEITAWYVVDLCGEGHLHVRCKKPIFTTQYEDLDRTFDLSDDGQLLSISCDLKDFKRYHMVKVFETATGHNVDAVTCAIPSGDILQENWHAIGRCACYHVFGGRHSSTLTMFTTCDRGVSFSHAS